MSILNITVIEKSESRRLKWLVETLVQGEWWYAITQPRILSFAHKVLTARRVKAEVALKGRVRFAYAYHDYPNTLGQNLEPFKNVLRLSRLELIQSF